MPTHELAAITVFENTAKFEPIVFAPTKIFVVLSANVFINGIVNVS
jgi:hypothetical protein